MAAGTLLTRDESGEITSWEPQQHIDRACTLMEEAEANFAIWGDVDRHSGCG